MTNQIIPLEPEAIKARIFQIRDQQVMLDKDLAALYEVKPIRLREQVQRNIERFPDDFMFQLTESEVDFMVSQNAIPSRKHLGGSLPYVFTEQGVASLAGVLRSSKAAEVHVKIMRAFVELRRFIQNNAQVFARLDSVERRQILLESESDKKFEMVFRALECGNGSPAQGIFFDGQIFDAYVFVNDLLRQAKKSIVLIDNYVDDTVLEQLAKRRANVRAVILTRKISKTFAQDMEKHNAQYPPVTVREFDRSHDRFLILDGETVYHLGASLKDLGKKWFAFSKLDKAALSLMGKVGEILGEEIETA
jgi:hypothetical protein